MTQNLTTRLRRSLPIRLCLVALGFNTLFLLWFIHPAVEPEQRAFYHWSGTAANFFLPVAIDFLAAWFVLFLLLWASRRPGRTHLVVWSGLIFLVPWAILSDVEAVIVVRPNHVGRALLLGALLATILLAIAWRPGFLHRFESFVALATTVLVFFGFFGGFLLCRLAWYGWQASSHDRHFPLHHALTASPAKPNRIIWIVMDELSYQQAYEHRFPGLELPAFDALAKGATSFTNAIPPDIRTEVIIPGLLAGKPFDRIRTSPLAQLWGHDANTDKWQSFDQHNTVFQDALDAGYSTAVAGWYNPYCRIIPEVLDQCFWTIRLDPNLSPSGSPMSNALAPFRNIVGGDSFGPYRPQKYLLALLHITPNTEIGAHQHIEDYDLLNADSNRLLRDRSATFVLLHLPVPHPLGIYDRHIGKFTTTNSSYIDNLALADKCLAGLRQTLEQTGQWDSSTIVVMGDHGWRTKQIWWMPKISPRWTKEDEAASHGGQYDPRPAYIVKLPSQTTGSRISIPYHTFNTRKLFDAIMAHKITTPHDLSAWAQQVH